MESELFGHKKGSFTGATQDKQGLIQSAHGGSLFLDEIAELPLSMQVKLLRAVQENAFVQSVPIPKLMSISVLLAPAIRISMRWYNKVNSVRTCSSVFT